MIDPAQSDPAAVIALTVTRFESVKAPTRWTDEQMTWGKFVESLELTPYLSKEAAPLHALYRLRRGGKRCNEDVETVYAVCLDFDHVSAEAVGECAARLQEDGIALLWHTTWSHDRPLDPANSRDLEIMGRWRIQRDQRRRIIVPLAEPLPAAQYDACLSTLWGRYAEHADRDAGGVHRAFYVPSRHPEREGELYYLPGQGLRFEHAEKPTPIATVHSISDAVWSRLAARWARSSSSMQMDLSERMKKILDGVSYAEHGERDVITWRLVTAIVNAYPEVSAGSVRELFHLSIDVMQRQGSSLTEEELIEKLERARRDKLASLDLSMPDERRASIRQAFGSDRDEPYTPDELIEIQSRLGLSAEQLDHSWILAHGSEHWLVGPGGVLVYSNKDALENTARIVLAPTPIELHELTPAGRQPMTRRRLLEKYSLQLDTVTRSLTINEPVFDLPNRSLMMPVCPRRQITPRFIPEVDQWLRLLAGNRYDQLCAWLQHFPNLSNPLAALVLTGPPSIGKGLLAQGLSRIWTEHGPTDLADALGTYDQAIESCPFCLADEALPKDAQGREQTERIREFVACTRRQVNQKYRATAPLEGATRVQIAANNLGVLTLGGSLSREDVDAIACRFLHVTGRIEAARYLEQRGGRDGAIPWVEGDGIAAHVLYLEQIRRYEYHGRFGVPSDPALVDRMLVRGGTRAALCELFVRALRDKTPLRDSARVHAGTLIVQLDWIPDAWDLWLGTRRKRPETPALLQALDGLGQRFEVGGEGWFAIETSRLVVWAREAGVGTPERVHEWLLQHEVSE